jgi:oligopeptide transport system ATP-binding protein
MSEIVLRTDQVAKHYPTTGGWLPGTRRGTVRAVDGVSLTLHRGETLGIVGESGCGKSTLARLLVALEKPTRGSVEVHGQNLHRLGSRALRRARRGIQIVLQDPYTSLNPRMTVGAIVAEPLQIHPDVVPRNQRRAHSLRLLELVGLNPEHVNRYPHQFSGGQRQRISVARALALQPSILVLDEPVSTLDVSVQAQVINLLQDLQEQLGLSYIFIAHDLSVVRHVSDRVAVMYLGQVVEHGPQERIYEQPGHPYTRALLSAVPVPDPTLRTRRERIVLTGDVPSPLQIPAGCRFHTRCWRAEEICGEVVPPAVRLSAGHEANCHFAESVAAPAVTATSMGEAP